LAEGSEERKGELVKGRMGELKDKRQKTKDKSKKGKGKTKTDPSFCTFAN